MTPEQFYELRGNPELTSALLNDMFNAPSAGEFDAVCTKWGITEEQAQQVCGDAGHTWTTGDSYTNNGLSCWTYGYCEVCGVADDRGYDDGL